MNKLEEKHLQAIIGNIGTYQTQNDEDEIKLSGTGKSAQVCTGITIEFTKDFAEWIDKNEIYKQEDGIWFNRITTAKYLTTSAMIEAYIKTI